VTAPAPDAGAVLRLDKWLWFARFFKSRTLAARHCAAGHVRVNGTRVAKAHVPVVPGDVLTFAAGSRIRVIRVAALGNRRGPAPEAQALYVDLDPPVARVANDAASPAPVARRDPGAGRPTKAERRALDQLRGDD
jgi:ribosome-associated heat shock protein Hsp15